MKNRYVGKIQVRRKADQSIIDTATVKTHSKRGKAPFIDAVLGHLCLIGKAIEGEADDNIDVFYQGDLGAEVNEAIMACGAKSFGKVKGQIEGV